MSLSGKTPGYAYYILPFFKNISFIYCKPVVPSVYIEALYLYKYRHIWFSAFNRPNSSLLLFIWVTKTQASRRTKLTASQPREPQWHLTCLPLWFLVPASFLAYMSNYTVEKKVCYINTKNMLFLGYLVHNTARTRKFTVNFLKSRLQKKVHIFKK